MFSFANRNSLGFRVYIKRGDLERVKEAIASGGTSIKEDIDGVTMLDLLRLAVEKEDVGFIKTLAENGVNLNLHDGNGRAIDEAFIAKYPDDFASILEIHDKVSNADDATAIIGAVEGVEAI